MKEVQISDGIVPLGEFKAQAAKLLKRIGESGQPMVITQNERVSRARSPIAGASRERSSRAHRRSREGK